MSIFVSSWSGSSNSTDTSTRIVSGSQTIAGGRILTEDGEGLLDEDGGDILEDTPDTTSGGEVDILTEDGGDLLTEDGEKVLDESSTDVADSNVGNGSKNVSVAGVSVRLIAASTDCTYVIVTAKEANTGTIWVGGADVAAGTGRPLVALQSERFDLNDVRNIYIDSTVNGEGVTFVYVNEDTPGASSGEEGSPVGLVSVETLCTYLYVRAKSDNTAVIWVGGSDIEVGLGIPLEFSDGPFLIDDIADVSTVYIAGNSGDGVTFFYGTTAPLVPVGTITDDDGNPITDNSGNYIFAG